MPRGAARRPLGPFRPRVRAPVLHVQIQAFTAPFSAGSAHGVQFPTDGASLEKRVPEAYHAWPEATVTSECTKTVTNTVIIGCHINLEDSTVTFKTHSGTENESRSTKISTTATHVCPLISVWDASCKITLNMGERDFEYPEFAVRVPDTMPYRDSIKGTLQ